MDIEQGLVGERRSICGCVCQGVALHLDGVADEGFGNSPIGSEGVAKLTRQSGCQLRLTSHD